MKDYESKHHKSSYLSRHEGRIQECKSHRERERFTQRQAAISMENLTTKALSKKTLTRLDLAKNAKSRGFSN
jgi:hypothetical protein